MSRIAVLYQDLKAEGLHGYELQEVQPDSMIVKQMAIPAMFGEAPLYIRHLSLDYRRKQILIISQTNEEITPTKRVEIFAGAIELLENHPRNMIMEIKTVYYSALINLGNYNNERIGFSADVSPNDSIPDILSDLRSRVAANASLNSEKVQQKLYEGRDRLEELEEKIRKAKAEWDAIADFLRAQGIKPDVPSMPNFTHLLPEVKSDRVVQGEIDDPDSDEEG